MQKRVLARLTVCLTARLGTVEDARMQRSLHLLSNGPPSCGAGCDLDRLGHWLDPNHQPSCELSEHRTIQTCGCGMEGCRRRKRKIRMLTKRTKKKVVSIQPFMHTMTACVHLAVGLSWSDQMQAPAPRGLCSRPRVRREWTCGLLHKSSQVGL